MIKSVILSLFQRYLFNKEITMKGIKEYLKNQDGQTSTEYILLIAVVAGVVFKLKGVMDSKLGNIMTKVFDLAEQMLNKESNF